MLTLARVLVLRPRLLIADELSLGLAPIVTTEVYRVLAQVRDAGCALLIVEQHLDHALELADHVVVLQQGEVTYAGTPGGRRRPLRRHPAAGRRPRAGPRTPTDSWAGRP